MLNLQQRILDVLDQQVACPAELVYSLLSGVGSEAIDCALGGLIRGKKVIRTEQGYSLLRLHPTISPSVFVHMASKRSAAEARIVRLEKELAEQQAVVEQCDDFEVRYAGKKEGGA